MSRSYREPYFTSTGSKYRTFAKRYANRIVRKTDDVPDGKAYRKLYCSWNISDFNVRWNPKPRIWWINGKQQVIEPTPEWKARMK